MIDMGSPGCIDVQRADIHLSIFFRPTAWSCPTGWGARRPLGTVGVQALFPGNYPPLICCIQRCERYYLYLMFPAGYKADAISHNIASEDIDHFLKHGSFVHGAAFQWFHRGVHLIGGNRI